MQMVGALLYQLSFMLYQTVFLLPTTLALLTYVRPDIDFPTMSHVTGSRVTVSNGWDKYPTASVCDIHILMSLVTNHSIITCLSYQLNLISELSQTVSDFFIICSHSVSK